MVRPVLQEKIDSHDFCLNWFYSEEESQDAFLTRAETRMTPANTSNEQQ